MGPAPVPEFMPHDTLVRKDGHRKVVVHPVLDCNWLQAMENSMDLAHLQILHQEFYGRGKRQRMSTTRGYTDDVESFEFYTSEYGLMKKRTYKTGTVNEQPVVFPSILRQGPYTQFRTPIDDEHTWHVYVTGSRGWQRAGGCLRTAGRVREAVQNSG